MAKAEKDWVWKDYAERLKKAGVAVELVSLRQRHAIKYWDIVQSDLKALEDRDTGANVGPFAYWNAVINAAIKAEFFVGDPPDPMDLEPKLAKWLAEGLQKRLNEGMVVPEA